MRILAIFSLALLTLPLVQAEIIFAAAEDTLLLGPVATSAVTETDIEPSSSSSGGSGTHRVTPVTYTETKPTAPTEPTVIPPCVTEECKPQTPAPTPRPPQPNYTTPPMERSAPTVNVPASSKRSSTPAVVVFGIILVAMFAACMYAPDRVPGVRHLARRHFLKQQEMPLGHAVYIVKASTAHARIQAAAKHMRVCVIHVDAPPATMKNITEFTVPGIPPEGIAHRDSVLTVLATIEEFLERDDYGLIAVTCIDKLGTNEDAELVASLLRIVKKNAGTRGAVLATATSESWAMPPSIRSCFEHQEASYS